MAEELHFGRAARRLFIAQPSLSQQVAALERELGVQLLERAPRVALTPSGVVLLERARELLAAADRAAAQARQAAADGGQLRLGFMGSAGRELLPALLRHVRSARPDVTVELLEVSLREAAGAVSDGTIDACFTRVAPTAGDVHVAELAPDPLVVAVPRRHPIAGGPPLPLDALREEIFVRPEHVELELWEAFIVGLCDRHGFAPRFSDVAASSHQGIIALVAADAGVAVVSATSHALPREGVVTVGILDAGMPLYLVTPAAPSPLVALVEEAIGRPAPAEP